MCRFSQPPWIADREQPDPLLGLHAVPESGIFCLPGVLASAEQSKHRAACTNLRNGNSIVSGRIPVIRRPKYVLKLRIEGPGVEPLFMGARDFFTTRSIAQLAEIQGVKPLKNSKTIVGAWPADLDLDAFLEEVYSSR
jgi:hypothetical protein